MEFKDTEDEEITLKGNVFDNFEEDDKISEIILLGKYGAIRRVMLKE